MNRFTRSSIALAALTLAGIFSFASKASADSAQVQLTTSVPTSCAFDAPSKNDGTLGTNFTTNTLDSTDTTNGGTSATIDLTCNNPGSKIDITNVAFTQPTGATATSKLVKVSHPDGSITHDGTTASGSLPITTLGTAQTVRIDAKAVYPGALIAGTYTFTVDLTANP